jgi:hypothetical protein
LKTFIRVLISHRVVVSSTNKCDVCESYKNGNYKIVKMEVQKPDIIHG